MASKLYNVLNGINKGIEKCKENAKLAGFPINDHTTLYALADMFKDISNIDSMRARTSNSWKRPDNWLDAENILRNAEERDGLQPRFILTYYDATSSHIPKYLSADDLKKSSNYSAQSYGVKAVLTSDGTWYTDLSSDITHTWGEPINGFHYIIGYSDDPVLPRFARRSTHEQHACEIIFGNCQVNQAMFDPYLISIQCLGDLIDPTMSLCYVGSNSNYSRLKNLDLSGIKILNCNASSALPTTTMNVLHGTYQLVSVNFQDVEELILKPQYSTTHITFTIPYLYVPKLKKITGSSSYQVYMGAMSNSARNSMFLDAPVLETIDNIRLMVSGMYAPKLTEISGSMGWLWINGNGASFYLPQLKQIGTGETDDTMLRINCSDNLVLPSLETCDYIDNDTSSITYGKLYLPKLHTLHTLGTGIQISSTYPYGYSSQWQYAIKGGQCIDAPSLKKIEYLYNGSADGGWLDGVNIPSIETIVFGLDYIGDATVVFPETLTTLPANCFKHCYGAYEIILPNNFAFSGLDLTNSTLLTKTNLRDIISKLADVTSDVGNTYTITFGTTNIAKLTDTEWQVARDKGWVVN